jgi:hypothetical protein
MKHFSIILLCLGLLPRGVFCSQDLPVWRGPWSAGEGAYFDVSLYENGQKKFDYKNRLEVLGEVHQIGLFEFEKDIFGNGPEDNFVEALFCGHLDSEDSINLLLGNTRAIFVVGTIFQVGTLPPVEQPYIPPKVTGQTTVQKIISRMTSFVSQSVGVPAGTYTTTLYKFDGSQNPISGFKVIEVWQNDQVPPLGVVKFHAIREVRISDKKKTSKKGDQGSGQEDLMVQDEDPDGTLVNQELTWKLSRAFFGGEFSLRTKSSVPIHPFVKP